MTEDQRKEQRRRELEWIAEVNREAWQLAARYLVNRLHRKPNGARLYSKLHAQPPQRKSRSRLLSNPRDRRETEACQPG